jgi:hypothetical protein
LEVGMELLLRTAFSPGVEPLFDLTLGPVIFDDCIAALEPGFEVLAL